MPGAWALRLGYAGLLPFVAAALLVWLLPPTPAQAFVAQALSAYAALIISFLGGIHWGHAMRGPVGSAALAWGVIAPLLSWPAVLMPAHAALVIHGLLLLACYAVDRRLYAAAGAQGWLTLRFRLSAVAALACFIGAAGS